jgi:hypothetical protein
MQKLLFNVIAALGLIPGLLILIPALHMAVQPPAGPDFTDVGGAQGVTLLWNHQVEIRIAGIRVRYYPRTWKTACLAVGLVLYVIGLASMFFGRHVEVPAG